MPAGRRRGVRQVVEITKNYQLTIMVFMGMVRSLMDLFSFTWTSNTQEIWNLPGPEPSFSLKYNFDYWIKNILSFVSLFRNFTTHLHLVFYVIMLYPVITGKLHSLMLPWLYLQMFKNIVTDLISTVAGVLLCRIIHPCSGLLTLEFLTVQIISTIPSIYLWRRLRAYYFDLYYAELDAEYFRPVVTKASHGLTLAQRRRATKSLDGGEIPIILSDDNRNRGISCLTYEDFFGPVNWDGGDEDADNNNKTSKSLTTLLTIESQESDDEAEEDNSRMEITDYDNLTPAERTLKLLGLTRGKVDKKTSVNDLGESSIGADQSNKSEFSVAGDNLAQRTVGLQVRPRSKSVSRLPENSKIENSKTCECCENTKCSKEDDSDSDSDDEGSPEIRYCCDRSNKKKKKPHDVSNPKKTTDDPQFNNNPKTLPMTSGFYKTNSQSISCLQAVIERDGIAWDNLKEINFVSVIKKSLYNELKPFKQQKDNENPILEKLSEREKCDKKIESSEFSRAISASFGIESDILALNATETFSKSSIAETQSFESKNSPSKQLIRPDLDAGFDSSYFKSSFQRHSNMFDDTRVEPLVGTLGSAQCSKVHSAIRQVEMEYNLSQKKIDGDSFGTNFNSTRIDDNDFPEKKLPTSKDIVSEVDKKLTQGSQTSEIIKFNDSESFSLDSEIVKLQTEEQISDKIICKESNRWSLKKIGETLEERKSKEIEALKAYNEKTLLKYKKRMEELKNSVTNNYKEKFRTPFSKMNCLYFPSVPELENRDKELILKMETAYGRFTRSKPTDQRKEFFGKIKISNKTGMRKQHSKYSKLTTKGVNEYYVTPSKSCKRIEGSQKCPEFDKSLGQKNIRVQNEVEVYFLEGQLEDKPSTSKNSTVTTIKSFSQYNEEDFTSATSSEVLQDHKEKSMSNIIPKNVKQVVENIDWSFRRPSTVVEKEKRDDNHPFAGLTAREDPESVRTNIVFKSTENILRSIFSHGENSERGFRLGESSNEFYPIFNKVDIAMKEIVRAAALRGFRDDFLSQPSTEIEIPEVDNGDIYGRINSGCETMRRSSSSRGFLRCNILSENRVAARNVSKNVVTTSPAASTDLCQKKQGALRREKDPLDQDETTSFIDDDETSSNLLRKLITSVTEPRSAEINKAIIGLEDVPQRPEDESQILRETSSIQFGIKNKTIYKISGSEVNKSQLEFDVSSFKRGLANFHTDGKEMQNIVVEFFNQFANFQNFKPSEFETAAESEETESNIAENSSLEIDNESESTNTNTTTNMENMNSGTSSGRSNFGKKTDQEDEENNSERRVFVDKIDIRTSSFENIEKRVDDEDSKKLLLNDISDKNSLELTNSEIINRNNFRREVISSAVVKAIKQGDSLPKSDEVTKVDSKFFITNYEDFNEIKSRNLIPTIAKPAGTTVLRNIETAERAIRRMKNIFQDFLAENEINKRNEDSMKSLKKLSFPINGEIEKLENFIQIVTNYVTVSESSQNEKESSEPPSTNVEKLETSSSKKTLQSSKNSKTKLDHFSSWDKVIPSSTKGLIAKNRRKNKPKKVSVHREPIKRVVKVVKLVVKKDSDFLSARSVPQKGRGLSSGYLMDSDSDGNFTVSRPLTPSDSLESEIGKNVSSEIFSNPLQASEFFSHSSHTSRLALSSHERPIETCWSISRNSEKEFAIKKPDVKDCDKEFHVLGIESLSIGSDLRCMTSLDAAGIENKLKDVVQQILNHKFSGINRLTNGLKVVSKNTSLASISLETRIDSFKYSKSASLNPGKENQDEEKKNDDLQIAEISTGNIVTGYKILETSNSVSIEELLPPNSKVSLKDVAIGTEYNVEVFKELLDIFGKICPIENEKVSDYFRVTECKTISNSSRLAADDSTNRNQNLPNIFTSSYDSFDSLYSRNIIQAPQPSISNETFIEEFSEQIEENDTENSLERETSVSNSEENKSGSSNSEDKSKKGSMKIPRLLKRGEERQSS